MFNVRTAILAGLLLTYVWRVHDLHPMIRPLRIAALISLSSWLLLLIGPRLSRIRVAVRSPQALFFLAWSSWMLVGAFTGISPSSSWDFITGAHIKAIAMVLFFAGSIDSFSAVRVLVVSQVMGASILAFFYAKGGFGTWGSPVAMYDVNDMALLFAVTLPFTFYIGTMSRSTVGKLIGWGLTTLLAICIAATRSRGGFLSLLIVALYLAFKYRGIGMIKRVAPILLVVVGFVAASNEARTRISTIFTLSEDYNATDQEGRIALWTRGIGYIKQHPVAGLGVTNFQLAERRSGSKGMVAHNSYVQVASETGIVGLLLFVGILASSAFTLRQLKRRSLAAASKYRVAMCDALGASLAAWTFGAFFLAWGYSDVLLVIVTAVTGLSVADTFERRATSGATAPHAKPFAV